MAIDRWLACDTSTKEVSWSTLIAPSPSSGRLYINRATGDVAWRTSGPPAGYSVFSMDSATDVPAWFVVT